MLELDASQVDDLSYGLLLSKFAQVFLGDHILVGGLLLLEGWMLNVLVKYVFFIDKVSLRDHGSACIMVISHMVVIAGLLFFRRLGVSVLLR